MGDESEPSLRGVWAIPSGRNMLLLALGTVAILIGVFARIYRFDYPAKLVFDEVYFPRMAVQYLQRRPVLDVHPPLGKLLMAGGIAVVGDRPSGWRIVPLIFGLANVPLMAAIWWSMFRSRAGALLVAAFMSIDGIFVAYSRTGLMDGILFFFVFAAFYLSLQISRTSRNGLLHLVLGMAASIKWIGLGPVVPALFLATRQGAFARVIRGLPWVLLTYVAIVTLGQVLSGSPNPVIEGIRWNFDAARFQAGLVDHHPYSSPWWSWPLMDKPVVFLYEGRRDGLVQVISSVGNPLVWRASSAAVLLSLLFLMRHWIAGDRARVLESPLSPLLVGYAACMVPWISVDRTTFIYHYMPAYGFAILMLAYWLVELSRSYWWVPPLFLLQVLVVAGRFLPLNVGWIWLPEAWARHAA